MPTKNSGQKPTEAQNKMLISLKQAITFIHLDDPKVPTTYNENQKQVFNIIVEAFKEIDINAENPDQAINDQLTTISNKIEYLDSITKNENAKKVLNKLRPELSKLQREEFVLKEEIASTAQVQAIESSSSKIIPSVSLMGGYAFNYQNFGFITELGVDVMYSTISSKAIDYLYGGSSNFEVSNNFNLYLAQKVGYKFTENTLTYATFGLGVKDTKISFDGYKKVNEKKNTMNMILGVGYEYKFNQLGIFTEFNHIASLSAVKTVIGDVKTSSQQVKIGARYYF